MKSGAGAGSRTSAAALSKTKHGALQAGMEKRPSLSRVINTLKCAIEKLQIAQGVESEKARQLTLDNYVGQVELLQTAFTSLADAVLEEIDTLAAERARAQREHVAMTASLQELEARVQGKLSAVARLEERLDMKLGVAAELPGHMERLAQQQAAGQGALEVLKRDVRRLNAQLSQLEQQQSLAASEAAASPLNAVQRSQVKEYAADQVQQQVTTLVAHTIASQVAPMIEEAVDTAGRSLRHDVAATSELLAADVSRLVQEAAAVKGDLAALAGGLQQQQQQLGALGPRVGRLEGLEGSNPRASLRLVMALEGKVDNLAAQQGRFSKSVESVVSALVDDTVGLNKSTRQLEGLVSHQQGQLQDTKEALLRSAKVFSQLLKIPTPVSSTLWGGGSPGRTSLGATASVSGFSPHGSPIKAASGSPILSKYASLLGTLG